MVRIRQSLRGSCWCFFKCTIVVYLALVVSERPGLSQSDLQPDHEATSNPGRQPPLKVAHGVMNANVIKAVTVSGPGVFLQTGGNRSIRAHEMKKPEGAQMKEPAESMADMAKDKIADAAAATAAAAAAAQKELWLDIPGHLPPASDVYMKIEGVWYAGIVITVCGHILIVFGTQLQKMSHLTHTPNACPSSQLRRQQSLVDSVKESSVVSREDEDTGGTGGLKESAAASLEDEDTYYWLQWRWTVGLLVWVCGQLMCFVALGLVPQSILACLLSLRPVVALALAPPLLGEALPANSFAYALTLVFGCIVVVAYGPRDMNFKSETVGSLGKVFVAPSSLVVHFTCLGILMITMCTSLLRETLLVVERYVLMSAVCAWYAVLFSKSMSIVLIASLADTASSQLTRLGFWVFFFLFVFFAIAQMHFINLGLRHGYASAVMPMYDAASMIGQLLFGGILFGEFHHFHARTEVKFIIGVLIVLGGLGLLVRSNRNREMESTETLPGTDQ